MHKLVNWVSNIYYLQFRGLASTIGSIIRSFYKTIQLPKWMHDVTRVVYNHMHFLGFAKQEDAIQWAHLQLFGVLVIPQTWSNDTESFFEWLHNEIYEGLSVHERGLWILQPYTVSIQTEGAFTPSKGYIPKSVIKFNHLWYFWKNITWLTPLTCCPEMHMTNQAINTILNSLHLLAVDRFLPIKGMVWKYLSFQDLSWICNYILSALYRCLACKYTFL